NDATISAPQAASTASTGKSGRNSFTPAYFGTDGHAAGPTAAAAASSRIVPTSRRRSSSAMAGSPASSERRVRSSRAEPTIIKVVSDASASTIGGVVIAVITKGACQGAGTSPSILRKDEHR